MSQWPIRRQEPDRGKGKTAQLSDGGNGTLVWSKIRLYLLQFKLELVKASEIDKSAPPEDEET